MNQRAAVIDRAMTGLRNALMQRGYAPDQARHFAGIILSRPGVTLTQSGVRYQGKKYSAADFAKTRLADYVTGALAQKQNESVIQGDPGYLASKAQLDLTKNMNEAGWSDQQRQAAIMWGDPAYAPDAQTGQAAAANPFSTMALEQQAYGRAQQGVTESANRAGTLFGGGQQSGQQEAGRIHALNLTEGTRSMTDLLSSLTQQRAQGGQQYSAAVQAALADAQQRLLQSGQIHAVTPPSLMIGRFRTRFPVPHPGQGAQDGYGGGFRNRYPTPHPPRFPRPPRAPQPPPYGHY